MIESFQRIVDYAKEDDKDLMLESFTLLCEATSLSSACKQWLIWVSSLSYSAIEASEKHPEWKESLGVVVFGNQSQQLQDLIPFRVYPLPYIKNEHELVDIYNAVDLFAIPSLEENLPNMVMEAMSCGVPCVGFNTGGIPEMIDHLHNGYVAQRKSSEDLANGIHWVLTEPEYAELSAQACRKAIGNYSESIIAKKYTDVYNKITGKYA